MRRPNESGRFVPDILQNLLNEPDSFVQGEAFDYLGEYAGNGDPNVATAIQQLLQRPDLSTDTLSRAAELLIDNYNLPLDQVREAIQNSSSTQALPEAELIYLQKSLNKLNHETSSNIPTSTITPH